MDSFTVCRATPVKLWILFPERVLVCVRSCTTFELGPFTHLKSPLPQFRRLEGDLGEDVYRCGGVEGGGGTPWSEESPGTTIRFPRRRLRPGCRGNSETGCSPPVGKYTGGHVDSEPTLQIVPTTSKFLLSSFRVVPHWMSILTDTEERLRCPGHVHTPGNHL